MSVKDECPYCLSPIAENYDNVCCDGCKALYHKECWNEAEGCCIRGCENFKNSVEIEVTSGGRNNLALSRDEIESAISYRQEKFSNPCLKCGRQVSQGSLYCAECTPEPQENQDTKNLGPLLIMLLIFVLTLILISGIFTLPFKEKPPPSPSEIGTNAGQ